MDAFARLPASERRLACIATADAKRLRAASIEKDFWVCWTLRALFSLPDIGDRITFKGGTSLSQAWQLIDRFSKDIDVVIAARLPASSLSDLVSFTGTHNINGSLLTNAWSTGCLIKRLYVSKPYANWIKRQFHGVLFTPFFSAFHFRRLSDSSPTSS